MLKLKYILWVLAFTGLCVMSYVIKLLIPWLVGLTVLFITYKIHSLLKKKKGEDEVIENLKYDTFFI